MMSLRLQPSERVFDHVTSPERSSPRLALAWPSRPVSPSPSALPSSTLVVPQSSRPKTRGSPKTVGRRRNQAPHRTARCSTSRVCSPPVVDHPSVWTTPVLEGSSLYIGASGLLSRTFPIFFLISTFAPHSTPSYFTFSHSHRASSHRSQPRPRRRAPYDYSVKFHHLRRRAACRRQYHL